MAGQRLKIGILGTGNIANQFAAGVRSSNRCALASVGSRNASSAKAFAEKNQIETAHDSYDALLADPDVEAIYLSLPNSMHHEWTIKSLRAGKHVLCEKPLAVTVSEGREMFDEARRAKRVLVEAFMYVSHPQTREVLRTVRDGAIGDLRLIRTSFCYRTTRVEGNIRFSAELCGGALMDVGCYCVHFSRLVAGSEPVQVSAFARMHENGNIDDATSAVMRFPGGVLATFSCGMSTQCDNTAHICGTEGYIQIAWPWKPSPATAGYTIAHGAPPRQDKGATAVKRDQTIRIEAPGELYALEADDFAATVLDDAPPQLSEEDSLGTLSVMEDLRRQIGLRF